MEEENEDYSKNKHFNLLIDIMVVIIMLSIILIPFIRKLEFQKHHIDENYWLSTSKCFELFFIDKDFSNWRLKKSKIEPVGKYIIGLSVSIAGYGDRIDELSKLKGWNRRRGYRWNLTHGRVPPKEILYAVRLTMALFGSFTCLLIYWIGRILWGVKAGIISSVLLAYNPLMLTCSRRAMTDAPLSFFLTANIILLIYFYRSILRQKLPRTIVFAALIGINCALAAGTKLNGGLAGVIFASFCIFFALIRGGHYIFAKSELCNSITQLKINREMKTTLFSLLISGIIATLFFVGMNPSLYSQPLKSSLNMIEFRSSEVYTQQKTWPLLDSLDKKVGFVVTRTLFPGKWNHVILGNILKIPIDFVLFLIGLIILLYNEIKYLFRNYVPSFGSIIIIWTVITFIGIIIWIPFDWTRYYLPVIPCIVIITGYCINKIIDGCYLLLKRMNPITFL